jgi:hypothetical protein
MTSARPALGKLAYARIVPPAQRDLFETETVEQQLMRALIPGTTVDRYNRRWHLGQIRQEDGLVFGRLGFESASGADIWDESSLDFQEIEVPAGVAAPFGVRLSDLLLVFQTRKQDIRVTSFTGAFQGILREATHNDGWHIETARRKVSFPAWRESVGRVTRLRFSIEPPNPNYEGRPDVERLIEGAQVAAATIELRASSDDSLNTDDDIVRQLLDHVERGYGESVAVGEREVEGHTTETVYNSKLEGETEIIERPADPANGEVTVEVLREELTGGQAGEQPG